MKIIFAVSVIFFLAFVHGMELAFVHGMENHIDENEMEKAIWEGWITKQGDYWKTMHKRWFELHKNGNFEYYTDINKNVKKGEANIKEDFKGYEFRKNEGAIIFKTSNREWYFVFETDHDAQVWIDFCNQTKNERNIEFPVSEEANALNIEDPHGEQVFRSRDFDPILIQKENEVNIDEDKFQSEKIREAKITLEKAKKRIILEKQNMRWFYDLTESQQRYVLHYFDKSIGYYGKFDEGVVKDMQEHFKYNGPQIEQLYKKWNSEILLHTGMNIDIFPLEDRNQWFYDLTKSQQRYILHYLDQSIGVHGKFNENVIKDMQEHFEYNGSQIEQLYEKLDSKIRLSRVKKKKKLEKSTLMDFLLI